MVIQEFFGATDQPRLNIRGSGIQSNPMNRGITLLQDGLPLNEADGSFVIGTLEPRDSALISVRRGGNAITPGATTLGVSWIFSPSPGWTKAGTCAWRRAASAAARCRWPKAFKAGRGMPTLSASGDTFDGYRHHSDSERTALRANVGYRDGNVEKPHLPVVDGFGLSHPRHGAQRPRVFRPQRRAGRHHRPGQSQQLLPAQRQVLKR